MRKAKRRTARASGTVFPSWTGALTRLLADQTGSVSTEYVIALMIFFMIVAVALAVFGVALLSHYSLAPRLLQSGAP